MLLNCAWHGADPEETEIPCRTIVACLTIPCHFAQNPVPLCTKFNANNTMNLQLHDAAICGSLGGTQELQPK